MRSLLVQLALSGIANLGLHLPAIVSSAHHWPDRIRQFENNC